MPELAEVYTVKEVLKKQILHKRIKNIKILYNKIIENDIEDFKAKLINKEFIDIKQKAKYLVFETQDNYLISHLRMEGKYFVKDKNAEIQKHDHIIFELEDCLLIYNDTRKFGRMELIDKDQLKSYFQNIGPDANTDIKPEYLYNKVKDKKIPIRGLLLDQSIIAGLGNIYADEVLYEAKLWPNVLGCNLSLNDCQNILNGAKKVLDMAIKYKGTTIRSYTSSLGVKGEYQNFLKVHTKEQCECGNKITKEKICGRTSYYCDKCQKKR